MKYHVHLTGCNQKQYNDYDHFKTPVHTDRSDNSFLLMKFVKIFPAILFNILKELFRFFTETNDSHKESPKPQLNISLTMDFIKLGISGFSKTS